MLGLSSFKKRVGPSIALQAGATPQVPLPIAKSSNADQSTLQRIVTGFFGAGNPVTNSSAQVTVPGKAALYRYYEADVFTPGAEGYVFESPFELTPVTPIWGGAFLRTPNTFKPLQPIPADSVATLNINGVGGVVSGQLVQQPLMSSNESGAL